MLLPQPIPALGLAAELTCDFLVFWLAGGEGCPPSSNVCVQLGLERAREQKRATPMRLFFTGTAGDAVAAKDLTTEEHTESLDL
jgi:hypothetical protein